MAAEETNYALQNSFPIIFDLKMKYLGHKNFNDGREQLLKEHLHKVSRLAEKFASEFGERIAGKTVGLYHDIGKYSEQFQKYIRGTSNKRVDHSTAGARELFNIKNSLNLTAAFCVAGHHCGLQNIGNPKIPDVTTFFTRVKEKAIPNFDAYKKEIEAPSANNDSELLPIILKDHFAVMFYTRMLFSCLVDADFLDTENFMYDEKSRRGKFTELETLKIFFDKYIKENFLNENNARHNEPINQRRRKILSECIRNGENFTENLLSLTVSTGGGKTVSSMAFALHNAIKNGRRRIIYVIPYTNIIEQTAQIFSNIFGSENVIEHNGVADYDDTESEEENIKRLATENWDAPIIVTTNVQFFESLFSNRTSKCRKLHNIANSVIIFDEAQIIPTEFLKPCVAAIGELTKHYKCTAVLCTATQPSLEKLFDGQSVKEICSEVEENYNFFRRTIIKVLPEKISYDELSARLKENRQVLCVVNKKRTAGKIFENLKDDENIFYLSTNLCPVHRTQILQKIKRCLAENQPCHVISTSLIEAGVDLDFPCVYRETSGLDSIIQSSGRCNREGKYSTTESFAYVFQLENEKPLRNQSLRINSTNLVCEKYFSKIDSPKAIKYYFDTLHKWEGDTLDKNEILKKLCRELKFKETAEKFKLINEQTKSVFIPYDESAGEIGQKILSGNTSRALMRKAGKYIVNVYEDFHKKLLASKKIEPADEFLAVLVDSSLYDSRVGLKQEVEDGLAVIF